MEKEWIQVRTKISVSFSECRDDRLKMYRIKECWNDAHCCLVPYHYITVVNALVDYSDIVILTWIILYVSDMELYHIEHYP